MNDRIELLWLSYERDVIPREAGSIQRIESKRAFFAGAASILGDLAEAISGEDTAIKEDEKIMLEVQQELENFIKTVGNEHFDGGNA